jgi:metallo-beta-lactamase family protein
MCEAGRILHHLKHRLWDPKSTILFVGYQSEGTLGRRLIDGAKTVSIMGEAIDVNAKVVSLEGFSAHADRDELLSWVRGFDEIPGTIFLVHGEDESKTAFADTLNTELGADPVVIRGHSSWPLNKKERLSAALSGGESPAGEGLTRGKEPGVDPEDMERLLDRLRSINDNLEGLLYRAKLASVEAANDGDVDSYVAIKNLITSLDSDTSKLAGELAGKKEHR